MPRFGRQFISVCICLVLQAGVVDAGWFGTDFSAELIQGTAQGKGTTGRMYVGAGRVRTEMNTNGSRLVEIIDPGAGRAWLLNTQTKRYRTWRVQQLTQQGLVSRTPCLEDVAKRCVRLPDEMLGGRNTSKWQLHVDGKTRLQWNDARYGFPLRVMDDGKLVMAMRFIATENLDGRRVEHWHVEQRLDGQVLQAEQWYDPVLNIAIRQTRADGSYRELRNIELAPQADELFKLPADYKPVATPPQQ